MKNNKKIEAVRTVIWEYYANNGRHTLPWRKTRNPYHILISEVMLQQTQVARVLPKYKLFIRQFPDATALSTAKLRDVLEVWSGLGYNRRAKHLQQTASAVLHEYGGQFPKTYSELKTLPGVGPYTAGAICAFVYNIPIPVLETNIRTVITHHFFPEKEGVSDKELIKIVELLLDHKCPREWYWAMMDYGAYLKTRGVKINRRSAHYKKQSVFKGSDREIRGMVIRILIQEKNGVSFNQLAKKINTQSEKVEQQLNALKKDGLVHKTRTSWHLKN